ncbi:hypothetical protein PX52LOC_05695 [Limnoglobus roseus]|uniref:Uncharacterized protein n=1 Tax=Limnoglobus roseus TaxID=2598579 RepID=A0A5C1AHF1_9BACT|nr:hypothetical protein PX52LOC_05695 [Limnoglobus roseus]
MPRKALLTLPTADTCRWQITTNDSRACGLVAAVLEVGPSITAPLSADVCEACCRSFPPSPEQLNPVVASLLYTASGRVLADGTIPADGVEKARQVRERALRSLNVAHPDSRRITPARETIPCHWLGTAVTASDGPVDKTVTHRCRHPRHEWASPSICKMCHDWAIRPSVSRPLTLDEIVPPPERLCGPAVRKWGVGITTSPRRQPTLEMCLDGVVRAGWEEPLLFLDGTVRIPDRYADLPVTWRENGIGAWPAWYLAMAELCFQRPDADAYVILQDDVLLHDRGPLREYLERVLWPGDRPGVISLFYTGIDARHGWSRTGWHWGAQGFVFPPGVARAMLADADLSRTWLATAGGPHSPIPERIHEWVVRAGVDVWFANPSLSQHAGNASTIWSEAHISGGRKAHWFSGSIDTEFAAEENFAAFPEEQFPCAARDQSGYQDRVDRGRERMAGHSVVICGLCRNVRHFLPRTAARVEKLGSMFRDYRAIFFENDSEDASPEFLRDWASVNPRVEFISEKLGVRQYPATRDLRRAAWLAKCRNRYRERFAQAYADYDYVIVLDTDLMGGWSYEGIAHTFGHESWDFVGSYGLLGRVPRRADEFPYVHFDTWAFHPAKGTAARQLTNFADLRLHRGDPLLPVESCFGGLGVYRSACLLECAYASDTGVEHTGLHDRMKRAGFDRLFLNPSQVVLYSPGY